MNRLKIFKFTERFYVHLRKTFLRKSDPINLITPCFRPARNCFLYLTIQCVQKVIIEMNDFREKRNNR
jgi:hypothetical protein